MKTINPTDKQPCIMIPSYGRAGKVNVLDCIPDELYEMTFIVVNTCDVKEYTKHYGDKVHIIEVGDEVDCIALKRQSCVEIAHEYGYTSMIMLDDMIQLYVQRTVSHSNGQPKLPSGEGRFMDNENKTFLQLYRDMTAQLDDYVQVGISPREGNNQRPGFGIEVYKVYGAQGLRVDVLMDEGIRFDGLYQQDNLCKLYEDYYLTISLFKAGYANYHFNDWAYTHHHNKKGGNSSSRTHEIQEHSVKALCEYAGIGKNGKPYMDIYQYDGPSQWEGLEGRWEIKRMFWKKLYSESCEAITASGANTLESFFLQGD